jgi:hypothetical protein
MALTYDLPGRTIVTSGAGTYDLPGIVVREATLGLADLDADLDVTESTDTIEVIGFREIIDSTTKRVYDRLGRTVITASTTRSYDLLGVSLNENAGNSGVEGTLLVTESGDTFAMDAALASSTRRVYELRGRTLIDLGLRAFDLPGIVIIEQDVPTEVAIQGEMVVTESSDTFAADTFGGLTADCDVDVLIDSDFDDTESTDTPAAVGGNELLAASSVTEATDTHAAAATIETDGVMDLVDSDELLFIVQEDEATVGLFPVIESGDTVSFAGEVEDAGTTIDVTESTDTVAFVGLNAIAAAIDVDEADSGEFPGEGVDGMEAEISRIVGEIAVTEDDDTCEFSDDDVELDPIPAAIGLIEESDTVSIEVNGWIEETPAASTWTPVTTAETEWAEAA